MTTHLSRLLGALLALASPAAFAQLVPAADFAKRPDGWGATLSPDGKHVAMEVPTADNRETQVLIVTLDGSGKTQTLRFGPMEHSAGVTWTTDDRIVVSRGILNAFWKRPRQTGELFVSGIDGKGGRMMFGYNSNFRDHGWADLNRTLPDEPGMVLVDFTCWNCGEEPDSVVYKVDTRKNERHEIERFEGRASFSFDRTGEARVRRSLDDNDEIVLHYRPTKGSAWVPVPKTLAGYTLYNLQFERDNNIAYAFVVDGREPAQVYRVDMAAGTRTRLAGKADQDPSSFMLEGHDGAPFAVSYNVGKPTVEILKPESEWTKLYLGLLKAFPGMMVSLGDTSRDGNRVLFSTWSDRDEGAWYLYDRDTRKVQKVLDYRPWMQVDRMAKVRPVSIAARDGTQLFALYTAPAGDGPKPMVVMPHGGPFGISDRWSFDRDAQFLASRGYAVLQVNYRGSGGRGEAFERSGWKQWGGLIQDDITDGVRWAISEKLADPERICIYGASFGGYSALMQPILNPGMYKCAIGYVGVYDLPLMRKTDKRDGQSKRSKRFWSRTLGDDFEALARISPAERAKEIDVPVFLVHGEDDNTADINQFKTMSNALRSVGRAPEEWVVKDEGHGFADPKNITEMYERLEKFLDKHIGPDAKVATSP